MKSRSMWSWVILTLFVIVPMVFVANLATGPQSVARGKAATLPLTDEMTAEQQVAQDAALADKRVQAYTTGYRTEVFGVQTISHQTNPALAPCASADCRQVNIFNFDESATIAAIVNVETGEVLDVLHQPGIRPLINKRLADRAMEIALSAPEVVEVLGEQPVNSDWAPMDSTLVGTACETGHMCVAPTFDLGDYILWAVVDLTDEKFVDLFWTAIEPEEGSRSNPYPYDEKLGCVATPGSVTSNGWSVSWETTAHDGFHVYNATYNGNLVLTSAKTVEWHADYGSSGYQDSTGCSGGGGGFTIYPYGNTRQATINEGSEVVGFELIQDFRMGSWGNFCNYRYEQRFQFYTDGRYRVVGLAYGKGCGENSLYRPIIRMDVAAGGDDAGDSIESWNGSAWAAQATEFRQGSTNPVNPDGYGWRLTDDTGSGYYIEPGRGQFGDNGLGDNEFIYAVQYKVAEGAGDLGIFGAGCCNDNNHGPEIYVNSESIANQNLVLWYVPQMMTNANGPNYYCWTLTPPETYPCYAGPMFVPIAAVTTPTAAFEWNGGANGPVAAGAAAQFANTSTGGGTMTYTWDFGDGSPTVTDPNPTHTYTNPGTYNVTLTVTNEAGTDSVTFAVTVLEPVIAGFAHTATTSVGQPTQFTDASTGGGTRTYLWDFGDGSPTVTDPNPTHTYNATGTFNVTLTVTNEVSSDTATSSIQVLPPTAVTLGGLSAERAGLPMLALWGLAGLVAMGVALNRISAMRRR